MAGLLPNRRPKTYEIEETVSSLLLHWPIPCNLIHTSAHKIIEVLFSNSSTLLLLYYLFI